MKKYLILTLLAITVGLTSGCITQLNSNIVPGSDLKGLKNIYVVRLPADKRGVERLIADRLSIMGYPATTGEKSSIPENVQAIVTYQDKWQWDITMYMIELNVQIRHPKTEVVIATGHALRTSLARKSPTEMVEEVLTDIYKDLHK